MIALKNNTGANLAQLIIGNEVEGLSNTRFVRKPEENAVYRVELQNVNNVTTKFVDWVEKDFLDIDKWNIKQVTFDNYEIKDGKIAPSAKQVLDYDNSEWKLVGSTISEDEELDKEKLDDMKDAFTILKSLMWKESLKFLFPVFAKEANSWMQITFRNCKVVLIL